MRLTLEVVQDIQFQSTLPHGSDLLFLVKFMLICPISIHAPSRERLFIIINIAINGLYFNPRSLTGATLGFVTIDGAKYISIHAPSRERLPTGVPNLEVRAISIHAPSRERHSLTALVAVFFCISIHAPSRERPTTIYIGRLLQVFQSTLPHGSDGNFSLAIRTSFYFNPRSLTGATASKQNTSTFI